jgi:SAM-dependent methyltransferase
MKVFDEYASYYDLFYEDKDNDGEIRFISDLIDKNHADVTSILDLGCGTGRHSARLAMAGHRVHGVDKSTEMLRFAEERRSKLTSEAASRLEYTNGDIRGIRLGKHFDVVLSLFHVVSYQPENEDVLAVLETVAAHLRPRGIFVFDIWYGPAVMNDPPVRRIKRIENKGVAVTRVADPIHYPERNLVEVNYRIHAGGQGEPPIKESHLMRYFFRSEIDEFLNKAGMKVIECGEWLTRRPPSERTWGIYFVATPVGESGPARGKLQTK